MDDSANMRIRRLINKRQKQLLVQNQSLPVQNVVENHPPVSESPAQHPVSQPTPALSSPPHQQVSSASDQLQSDLSIHQTPSTSSTLHTSTFSFNPNERRGGVRTFVRNQPQRPESTFNAAIDDQPLLDQTFEDVPPPSPSSSSSGEQNDNLFIVNDEPFDPRPSDRFLNSFELKYMQLCLELNLTEHASSRILEFIKECNIDEAKTSKS